MVIAAKASVSGKEISFTVNSLKTERQIEAIKSGLDAMIVSTQNAGAGQVLTGQRRKKRWEKQKPLHGTALANIFRSKGIEIFQYDPQVEADVVDQLEDEITDALDEAYRLARDTSERIKMALTNKAKVLAKNVQDRLAQGRAGRNTGRTRDRKKRLTKGGYATTQYGGSPPFGVETGRFLEGITGGWKMVRRRSR